MNKFDVKGDKKIKKFQIMKNIYLVFKYKNRYLKENLMNVEWNVHRIFSAIYRECYLQFENYLHITVQQGFFGHNHQQLLAYFHNHLYFPEFSFLFSQLQFTNIELTRYLKK